MCKRGLMIASSTRLEVTYLTRRYDLDFVAVIIPMLNKFQTSILLDLDVRTKPVWNRRLAEEWRKSILC
jgi:hypothetical protein